MIFCILVLPVISCAWDVCVAKFPPLVRSASGDCGKTRPSCHPEQQRRICIGIFKQLQILRRLLAPQNDGSFEFFRKLSRPPRPSEAQSIDQNG
jgi:hypothetical protein